MLSRTVAHGSHAAAPAPSVSVAMGVCSSKGTISACTAAEPLSSRPQGTWQIARYRPCRGASPLPSSTSCSPAADKPSLAVAGLLANAAGIIDRFRREPLTATCEDTWPAEKHLFSVGMRSSRPDITRSLPASREALASTLRRS